MVIEQGAKLGAKWRQHVQAQTKRVCKSGFAIQGILKRCPLSALQGMTIISVRQAQTTFWHQAVISGLVQVGHGKRLAIQTR